jgi:hypothetical protein
MNKREQERQEAIDHLREMIKPGNTVHTILKHVSRSGMTRGIDVYFLKDSEPIWITAYVGKAIDQPQPADYWRKSLGLKIGGCGMDMGFHVVENLSYALYGKGYQCLGKGKCPSNYHNNHHDTIRCEGNMVYNPDGPNTGSYCQWDKDLMTHVIFDSDDENAVPRECPKCKGKGGLPNPEGPERFDLVHTDGYALKHKWL